MICQCLTQIAHPKKVGGGDLVANPCRTMTLSGRCLRVFTATLRFTGGRAMDWGDTDWQLAVLSAPIAPAGGRIDKAAARVRCAPSQWLV